MRIVFLGPPGVGKGTQGLRFSKYIKGAHISTGDILRTAVRDHTELGGKVAGMLDKGKLVGDRLMVDLIKDRLRLPDAVDRFLLDGFPRTLRQAEALEEFLKSRGSELTAVILLVADPAEIQRRLLARAKELGRSDDTPETIAHRLDVYQQRTAPLIDHYEKRGKLLRIDGMGSMDEVFARIVAHFPKPAEKSGS